MWPFSREKSLAKSIIVDKEEYRWFSVEEDGLPPFNMRVLVQCKITKNEKIIDMVTIATYCCRFQWDFKEQYSYYRPTVTYWMFIPYLIPATREE